MPHRFSPHSTKAIKNNRKKELNNKIINNNIVWYLISIGFTFNQALEVCKYKNKDINFILDKILTI